MASNHQLLTKCQQLSPDFVYGEKSDGRIYLPDRNGGAIEVDSATHQLIADQAVAILKYDLDHVSIIQSSQVADEIARFLKNTEFD